MSDFSEPAQWLREHLARQGLQVAPERFAAFAQAHQRLQAMTEQLRQLAQPLPARDDGQ